MQIENGILEYIMNSDLKNGVFTIPGTVKWIGIGAFRNCHFLTKVNIPNSVTYIDFEAFENCFSLEDIVMPNSVTHIGVSVFSGCDNLQTITINNVKHKIFNMDNNLFFIKTEEKIDDITIIKCQEFIGVLSKEIIGFDCYIASKYGFNACDTNKEIAIEKLQLILRLEDEGK